MFALTRFYSEDGDICSSETWANLQYMSLTIPEKTLYSLHVTIYLCLSCRFRQHSRTSFHKILGLEFSIYHRQ
jgi:hypothetical protein